MKMMLDNWDIALGIGSILIIAAFVWFTFRRSLKVHVTGEQTKRNRDAI